MIKAVLIDIDDTVLDFNKCAAWAMQIAMEENGLKYDSSMFPVFRRVNNGFWSRLEKNEITFEYLVANRFNAIFKDLGITFDGTIIESRFRELLHESTEEVDGARDLLVYLHEKYKIYAVSNALQAQQENRLKKDGLIKYFDGIYTSEMLGASKPSHAFFDAFFARVGDLKKDEVVLIGDSLSADISGGKKYGLMTCWFNGAGKDPSRGSFSDFTVTSLSAIKAFM